MNAGWLAALLFALASTGMLVWTVGFSKRWRADAMSLLERQFGVNVDDEEVAEDARQDAARVWFGLSAVAWLIVAWLFPGGAP